MLVHDGFEWTNALVGGLGLIASALGLWAAIVAAKNATKAKQAAEKARESVQKHRAENDFSDLLRMVTELRGHVDKGQLSEAKVRMTDLRRDLSTALGRHEWALKSKWTSLQEQQLSLKLAADGLNRITGDLSKEQRNRLLEPIDAIMEVLAGQYGALGSKVEKEVFRG